VPSGPRTLARRRHSRFAGSTTTTTGAVVPASQIVRVSHGRSKRYASRKIDRLFFLKFLLLLLIIYCWCARYTIRTRFDPRLPVVGHSIRTAYAHRSVACRARRFCLRTKSFNSINIYHADPCREQRWKAVGTNR